MPHIYKKRLIYIHTLRPRKSEREMAAKTLRVASKVWVSNSNSKRLSEAKPVKSKTGRSKRLVVGTMPLSLGMGSLQLQQLRDTSAGAGLCGFAGRE